MSSVIKKPSVLSRSIPKSSHNIIILSIVPYRQYVPFFQEISREPKEHLVLKLIDFDKKNGFSIIIIADDALKCILMVSTIMLQLKALKLRSDTSPHYIQIQPPPPTW